MTSSDGDSKCSKDPPASQQGFAVSAYLYEGKITVQPLMLDTLLQVQLKKRLLHWCSRASMSPRSAVGIDLCHGMVKPAVGLGCRVSSNRYRTPRLVLQPRQD